MSYIRCNHSCCVVNSRVGASGVVSAVGAIGHVCWCMVCASVVSDINCVLSCCSVVVHSLLPSCAVLPRVVLVQVVLCIVR